MDSEYIYGPTFQCTETVVKDYKKNGYIIVRSLFNEKEMTNLRKQIFEKDAFKERIYQQYDGKGTTTKKAIWSHPGNDVTGMMARSEKLTGIIEKLLGKEIYQYHAKIQMKEAKTGGTFQWHQDFGYWYYYGCIFPDDLLTVFAPIDRCDRSNGCLQLLKGSHRCGRVDHTPTAHQRVADEERVKEMQKRFPSVFAELDPGDAIIFQSNVLHTSGKNESDNRRYAYLMCFNTKENDPIKPWPHAAYTPLEKVPNESISECTNYMDLSGKDFFLPDERVHVIH